MGVAELKVADVKNVFQRDPRNGQTVTGRGYTVSHLSLYVRNNLFYGDNHGMVN